MSVNFGPNVHNSFTRQNTIPFFTGISVSINDPSGSMCSAPEPETMWNNFSLFWGSFWHIFFIYLRCTETLPCVFLVIVNQEAVF